MSQQVNNGSSRGGVNILSEDSFLDALAHFLENVKRETKDTFELLNYPCVYQNPKKRIGVDDIPMLKRVSSLNIVSVKDKIHVDKFLEQKKQLIQILEHVRYYSKQYKMKTSLVSMCELLVMFHCIIEFKIGGIISTLQEHNIAAPQLNSNIPVTLAPYMELHGTDEDGTFMKSFTVLPVNGTKFMSLLKSRNTVVNFLNMDPQKKEIALTNTGNNYHFENNNSSDNSNSFFSSSKEKTSAKNMERKGTDDMTEMRIAVEKNVESERHRHWGTKMRRGNGWEKEKAKKDERKTTRGSESEKQTDMETDMEREMEKVMEREMGRKIEMEMEREMEKEIEKEMEKEMEKKMKMGKESEKQRLIERQVKMEIVSEWQMKMGKRCEFQESEREDGRSTQKEGKAEKQQEMDKLMKMEREVEYCRDKERENESPRTTIRKLKTQRILDKQMNVGRLVECYMHKERKNISQTNIGKEDEKKLIMEKEGKWLREKENENKSPMKKSRDSDRQRETKEQTKLKRIKLASLVLDDDDDDEDDDDDKNKSEIEFGKKGEFFEEYKSEEKNRGEKKFAVADKVLEYGQETTVDLGLSPETDTLFKLLMKNRKSVDMCTLKNRNCDI